MTLLRLAASAILAGVLMTGSHARADDRSTSERLLNSLTKLAELSRDQVRIVSRARLEVERGVKYAGTWQRTSGYPMGDIPEDRGACTDLVVRSLRAAGIDLQRMVHEDMLAARDAYGIDHPDPTIDHRRVSTLLVFFERHAMRLGTSTRRAKEFEPGDVVFFGPTPANPTTRLHVGIVSDKRGPRGLPLVLENGGPRPVESDTLDRRPIVGHFRPQFDADQR